MSDPAKQEAPNPLVRLWRFAMDVRGRQTILFSVIALFLNADQNLTGPNLTQIGVDFGFDNVTTALEVGGYASAAFWVVGGISAVFVGWYGDRFDRHALYAALVFLGELSCLCTLAVTSFGGFVATRAFTGLSIGGSTPLLYSMVGDLYTDSERGRVTAFIVVMVAIGNFVGVQIASQIGPVYGWRAPYAVVAVPSLVLAPIFYFTTSDPKRANAEKLFKLDADTEYDEKLTWAKAKALLSNVSVFMLVFQGIPGSAGWGLIYTYFQDYLAQNILVHVPSEAVKSSAERVSETALVVTTFGLGAGVGTIAGGLLADYWWPGYSRIILLMSFGVYIGAIPMFLMINLPAHSLSFYAGLSIPAGLLLTFTSAGVKMLLLNVVVPEMRGTAFAMLVLFDDLGKGLAPLFVSGVYAAIGDKVSAFNIAMAGWYVSGSMTMFLLWSFPRDMERFEQALRKAHLKQHGSQAIIVVEQSASMRKTDKFEEQL